MSTEPKHSTEYQPKPDPIYLGGQVSTDLMSTEPKPDPIPHKQKGHQLGVLHQNLIPPAKLAKTH